MNTFLDIPLSLFLFFSLFTQVFLLVTFFEWRNGRKIARIYESAPKSYPDVTVIVPCWNEVKTLERTVASLCDLEYPDGKFRIIIVNDGSTDGTGAVADRLAADRRNIVAFHKSNGGKHTALNWGLKHADTEFVGCLDADSFVWPDALKKIMSYFDDPDIMAVTPYIVVDNPRGVLARVQSAEYAVSGFFRAVLGALNALFVTPGPFSIYRGDVFRKIGGFRPGHQTEDLEMALRMQAHRMRIANSPASFVSTVAPTTFKQLLRQRVRWQYGFLNNAMDYKHLFLKREFGHLGFFSLPAAVISIFSSLFLSMIFLADTIRWVRAYAVEILTVGFNWRLPRLELFFWDTGPLSLLAVFIFLFFGAILLSSRNIVDGKFGIPKNGFWYLAFYGFLAPIWYAKAVYATLTSRTVFWR